MPWREGTTRARLLLCGESGADRDTHSYTTLLIFRKTWAAPGSELQAPSIHQIHESEDGRAGQARSGLSSSLFTRTVGTFLQRRRLCYWGILLGKTGCYGRHDSPRASRSSPSSVARGGAAASMETSNCAASCGLHQRIGRSMQARGFGCDAEATRIQSNKTYTSLNQPQRTSFLSAERSCMVRVLQGQGTSAELTALEHVWTYICLFIFRRSASPLFYPPVRVDLNLARHGFNWTTTNSIGCNRCFFCRCYLYLMAKIPLHRGEKKLKITERSLSLLSTAQGCLVVSLGV